MKKEICKRCESSSVSQQPLGFHYTKENAPSYMLKCSLKRDRFDMMMECKYVRECPLGKENK